MRYPSYPFRRANPSTAHDALRDSEARLEGIIASAMDAIISIDSRQRIVLFNPAAEKMFGVSTEQALGERIDRFIPDRFRLAHRAHVAAFGQTGVSTRHMGALGKVSGLRATGEEFPIEASISQVEVAGEKIFTVILRDITEREAAEAELNAAQEKLSHYTEDLQKTVAERTAELQETVHSLEAICYHIAHDLRAPLRSMEGFSSLLASSYAKVLDERALDFLGRISNSASQMDNLIGDLLAYGRIGHVDLPFGWHKLDEVVGRVLAHLSEEVRAKAATVQVQPAMPEIWANATLLEQILINLVCNALTYVAPGVVPSIQIGASTNEHSVTVFVRDNGIGIAPEYHQKIFQVFERLHDSSLYPGSGIGLAIVQKAVQRMGGQIHLESQLGRGSCFSVELPNPLGEF